MTDDAEKELFVADLTAFTPSGPSVLFIRSRRVLTHDEESNCSEFLAHMRWPPGIVCVWLPFDTDVFAAGEAEMKRLGWMRIPEPEPT